MRTVGSIARGGFGIVERVMLDEGEVVARKTFSPPPHAASGDIDKFKRRFAREVRVQAALNQGIFLPVLGSDLDAPQPWFLMPLAERSLADEIESARADGTIPTQALADILNGLEELHRLGMVHRDLKPQNVLLHQGVWKLSDFGLVLPLGGQTTCLTSTDSAWGTTHYASPEQAVGFHAVDSRTDIYAFGCILHDIFGTAPRIPFNRHTGPGQIGAIIEKCTEQDPRRRFVSVAAIRTPLLAALGSGTPVVVDAATADWINRLDRVRSWSADDVTSMARAIRALPARSAERDALLRALTEEHLEAMFALNCESWKVIALEIAEWAEGAFEWTFCDVLVGRLISIFSVGDFEAKACAVVAAAELGASHNRWHVMRRLGSMTGPEIDPTLAQRIAIELQARGKQNQFRQCAYGIDTEPAAMYHPFIAACLD